MFNVESLNLTLEMEPRADNILVLPLIKAGASKLILEVGENRELPEFGVVIAVGPGGFGAETGRPIPMMSAVGEKICFGKYSGTAHELVDADERVVPVFIMPDSLVMMAAKAGSFDLLIHDNDPRKMHDPRRTCEFCEVVTGEAGVERLRLIASGVDPDAPAAEPEPEATPSAIEQERERLRQAREREDLELAEHGRKL